MQTTDARSDRHTSFTNLLKRKANTHLLIVRQQAYQIDVLLR